MANAEVTSYEQSIELYAQKEHGDDHHDEPDVYPTSKDTMNAQIHEGARLAAVVATGESISVEQQRLDALDKGNKVRTRRAELKGDLKLRKVKFAEIMDDEAVKNAQLLDMLAYLPVRRDSKRTKKISKATATAERILTATRLSSTLSIGELTQRQRDILLEYLETKGY